MFDREIHLSTLTEDDLGPLLDAALTADPTDVMPPVSDPIDGWTEGRRQAFRRFHRQRLLGPEPVEKAYVVRVDGHVVGAGRVRPIGTEADIGLWLAPRWRRLGIGSVVAAQLVQLARQEGIREVTATTTVDNTGALTVLGRVGAAVDQDENVVRARLPDVTS